jgi:hypothetical protein
MRSAVIDRRYNCKRAFSLHNELGGSPRWLSAGASVASISPFRPTEMRFAHPRWASAGYRLHIALREPLLANRGPPL